MYRLSNHFLNIHKRRKKIVSKKIFFSEKVNKKSELIHFTKSYIKNPIVSYFPCTNVLSVCEKIHVMKPFTAQF